MSEKPTVHEALSKVMEDVRSVRKGERNSHQNFMFRGIDAVMNAVGPALRKHGVLIVPSQILDHTLTAAQTSQNKSTNVCKVRVEYTVYGPAGDSITMQTPGESMDSGDKATAKAMSVAYRTCLLQALTLPTDETDPDADTYEAQHQPRTQQAPQQGTDWQGAFNAAKGNKQQLEALRNQAKQSGMPDDAPLAQAIAKEIQALTESEPVEGQLV